MGISASPGVFPVLISGPFYEGFSMYTCEKQVFRLTVSRAMASGRPGISFAEARALSMTDWWYYSHD